MYRLYEGCAALTGPMNRKTTTVFVGAWLPGVAACADCVGLALPRADLLRPVGADGQTNNQAPVREKLRRLSS